MRKKDSSSLDPPALTDSTHQGSEPMDTQVVLSAATIPGFEEPLLAAPVEPINEQPTTVGPTGEE